MRIVEATDTRAIERLLAPARSGDRAFERRVQTIVDGVRTGGDPALARFARRFDHVSGPLEVSARGNASRRRPCRAGSPAGDRAGGRTTSPASPSGRFRPTSICRSRRASPVEQRIEPLARVGCYVPGGRFPLPSSLLMTAVPARVAGVREIIAVCPRPEPAVMAAALEAGVTRLFRIGGAHAIAALAYGTTSVPARGQDRRPRQPLRRRRQSAGGGPLRHRFLRRTDRDRHRRRRRTRRRGLPRISSPRPSTIRMRARF